MLIGYGVAGLSKFSIFSFGYNISPLSDEFAEVPVLVNEFPIEIARLRGA